MYTDYCIKAGLITQQNQANSLNPSSILTMLKFYCHLLQRLHTDKNKNLFHSLQILAQKSCRLLGNNMAYSEFTRYMPNRA
nr:MAG TPA: hypothetical protein [Bacteriophage sp.]